MRNKLAHRIDTFELIGQKLDDDEQLPLRDAKVHDLPNDLSTPQIFCCEALCIQFAKEWASQFLPHLLS